MTGWQRRGRLPWLPWPPPDDCRPYPHWRAKSSSSPALPRTDAAPRSGSSSPRRWFSSSPASPCPTTICRRRSPSAAGPRAGAVQSSRCHLQARRQAGRSLGGCVSTWTPDLHTAHSRCCPPIREGARSVWETLPLLCRCSPAIVFEGVAACHHCAASAFP